MRVHPLCPQVGSEGLGLEKVAQDPWVVSWGAAIWIKITGDQIRKSRSGQLRAEGRPVPPPRAPLLTASITVSCSATRLGGKVRMLHFSSLIRCSVAPARGCSGAGHGAGSVVGIRIRAGGPGGSRWRAGPGAEGEAGAGSRPLGAEGGDTDFTSGTAEPSAHPGAGPSWGSGALETWGWLWGR